MIVDHLPTFRIIVRVSYWYSLPGKIASLPAEEKETEHYTLPHPIWSKEETEGVEITHTPPKGIVDKVWLSLPQYAPSL